MSYSNVRDDMPDYAAKMAAMHGSGAMQRDNMPTVAPPVASTPFDGLDAVQMRLAAAADATGNLAARLVGDEVVVRGDNEKRPPQLYGGVCGTVEAHVIRCNAMLDEIERNLSRAIRVLP